MNINRFFFWLTIVNGLVIETNAEYIIYQSNGQAVLPIVDKQAYSEIYKVLQTYQWPMLLGSATKIDPKELEELTKKDVENAEEKFLRKKIKEISPDYDIAFIPTLIYEIFYVQNISNYVHHKTANYPFDEKDVSKMASYQSAIQNIMAGDALDKKIYSIITKSYNTVQNIYNYFNTINRKKQSQKLHMMLNNGLVQIIKNRSSNIQQYIDQFGIIFLENIIQSKITPWVYNFVKDTSALKKIIETEYEARKKNVGVLYRSGKSRTVYIIGRKKEAAPIEGSFLATTRPANVPQTPVPTYAQLELEYKEGKTPTKTRDWFLPLNSVSYGNSIFSGFWEDVGACVCSYLNDPALIGYALFIDKEKYINNKLDLFFISSLNTITSMSGEGEFFHSRTRSFASSEYFIKNDGFLYVPGFQGDYDFKDNSGIFAPIGDPLEKAKELSEFIQENAKVLKLPNNEGGFNFTKQEESRLIRTQIDLTDMLKAMITIRKAIRGELKKKKQSEKELSSEAIKAEGKHEIS